MHSNRGRVLTKLLPLVYAMGILTASMAGCDFGHTYQQLVDRSLETLRHAEQLSAYLQATAWSNNPLGFTLRAPQGMQRLREPTVDAAGKVTAMPDPEVVPPPSLSLPNRLATFRSYIEVGVSGDRRRLPMFLYVAAATASAGEGESQMVPSGAFREQVIAAFRQAFPARQNDGAEPSEPVKEVFPKQDVYGVSTKEFTVLKGATSAEFISLRGGRDRQVPESAEATAELYLYEDANRNQAALVFYWPQATIQAENPAQLTNLRRQIESCLETVAFKSS